MPEARAGWMDIGRGEVRETNRRTWPLDEYHLVPCAFTVGARTPSADAQLPGQVVAAHAADDAGITHDDELVRRP